MVAFWANLVPSGDVGYYIGNGSWEFYSLVEVKKFYVSNSCGQ